MGHPTSSTRTLCATQRLFRLCGAVAALLGAATLTADEPPSGNAAVTQALQWQMPENPCVEPTMRGKGRDVIHTVAPNAARYSDVDHYTLQRYQRKMKRWQACENKYRVGLYHDAMMLQKAAQQGMTETQLEDTRQKLIAIKMVLMPEADRAATSSP